MCLALAAACHAAPQLLHHGVAHHAAVHAPVLPTAHSAAILTAGDAVETCVEYQDCHTCALIGR